MSFFTESKKFGLYRAVPQRMITVQLDQPEEVANGPEAQGLSTHAAMASEPTPNPEGLIDNSQSGAGFKQNIQLRKKLAQMKVNSTQARDDERLKKVLNFRLK